MCLISFSNEKFIPTDYKKNNPSLCQVLIEDEIDATNM
jgi:hypothetical protein